MPRVLFCLLLALVLFAPGQEQTSTVIPLRILVLNSAEESARVRAGADVRGVDGGGAEVAHLAERSRPPIVIVPKLNTDTLNPDVPKRRCSISGSSPRHARLDIPIAAV
jgi:hypothetical protein